MNDKIYEIGFIVLVFFLAIILIYLFLLNKEDDDNTELNDKDSMDWISIVNSFRLYIALVVIIIVLIFSIIEYFNPS